MKRWALLILLSLISIPAARAQNPGGQFTSFFGFTIGHHTIPLKRIMELYGHVIMDHGEEHDVSICYRGKDGYIEFLSGEMGGRRHDLLGFAIKKKAPSRNCGRLEEKYYSQKLELGPIHFDMKRKEFINALGSDVKRVDINGDQITGFFEYRRPMTDAEKLVIKPNKGSEYFDGSISVTGTFSKNTLTSARVWKTETY